jgi:hypothetical protein
MLKVSKKGKEKSTTFPRFIISCSMLFRESTAWIFPLYFQLPYLPEETCFQQAGSSAVEGTSEAVLRSSD